jgi:hypothetical protein
MPRRRVAAKRTILPDPKYSNQILAKFINHVMVSGKKSVAEGIVYGALDRIRERGKSDPVETFEKSSEAVAPYVSQIAARGWCKSIRLQSKVRRRDVALGGAGCPTQCAAVAKNRCRRGWLVKSSTGKAVAAARSQKRKTHTAWQRRTRPFHTIDHPRLNDRSMPRTTQYHVTATRRYQHVDAAGKTTTTERILFYTGVSQNREVHDGAASWIGWSRSKSAASRLRPRVRVSAGWTTRDDTASTSSTPGTPI